MSDVKHAVQFRVATPLRQRFETVKTQYGTWLAELQDKGPRFAEFVAKKHGEPLTSVYRMLPPDGTPEVEGHNEAVMQLMAADWKEAFSGDDLNARVEKQTQLTRELEEMKPVVERNLHDRAALLRANPRLNELLDRVPKTTEVKAQLERMGLEAALDDHDERALDRAALFVFKHNPDAISADDTELFERAEREQQRLDREEYDRQMAQHAHKSLEEIEQELAESLEADNPVPDSWQQLAEEVAEMEKGG